MTFLKKWYIYQKERFPVLIYGIYILAIVLGTFAISNIICNNASSEKLHIYARSQLHGAPSLGVVLWIRIIPMYIVTFLQFLMVRIIDEFKDYKEDCKYRPYRPVPRGLITLKELKILFIICVILQFGITLFVEPVSVMYLIGVWIFFALMSKSFFIKKFLDKHILIELILDELLMPILVVFLSRFITYVNPTSSFYSYINIGDILPFIIMTYIISCIVEIARKVRCKEDEEKGVKTYTAVLGINKTIFILCMLETIIMILQLIILGKQYLLFILSSYVVVNVINLLFVIKKNKLFAKLTEISANLYILIAYFSLLLLL